MKKIPSVFCRNYDGDRLLRDEVVPGCEWVLNGEGVPTAKFDGTACLVKDGALYKRYDAKNGKTLPAGFFPAQEPDETTGHWPGWLPIGVGPEDRWHREAWDLFCPLPDGTYELVGPKIQGNPHAFQCHLLLPHGKEILGDGPRSYEVIRAASFWCPFEGVVWHHPDGRMAKVKRRDFGFEWPIKKD